MDNFDRENFNIEIGNATDNESDKEREIASDTSDRDPFDSDGADKADDFTSVVKRGVIVPEPSDEQLLKESKTRYYRMHLVFSLLGIMFSFAYGIGIAFSILALVKSAKLRSTVKSVTIKWAYYLAIVGLILNVFTAAAYFAFFLFAPSEIVDPVPEALILSIIDL